MGVSGLRCVTFVKYYIKKTFSSVVFKSSVCLLGNPCLHKSSIEDGTQDGCQFFQITSGTNMHAKLSVSTSHLCFKCTKQCQMFIKYDSFRHKILHYYNIDVKIGFAEAGSAADYC